MDQRAETYNRQQLNYGHNCCKNCFGNEPSFKLARKRVMLFQNPFKGKKHTLETRDTLSKKAMGRPAWNKGIRKSKKAIIPGSINRWIKFKNQFLADFGDCCFKCSSINRLEVHHLASKKRFPAGHYREENCIALCYWCHKDFHKKYSRTKFEYRDTIEWLNEGREKKDFVILH